MEAKDLMIGDWVCVTKNFAQKYHRIRVLSNDEEDVLKGTYINDYGVECNSIFSLNDIEPIPLTPEILEKNGFKCDAHPKYICDSYFIDGISLLDFRGGYFKYVAITLEYVHQLQHLLKLRNIDKEIEL